MRKIENRNDWNAFIDDVVANICPKYCLVFCLSKDGKTMDASNYLVLSRDILADDQFKNMRGLYDRYMRVHYAETFFIVDNRGEYGWL